MTKKTEKGKREQQMLLSEVLGNEEYRVLSGSDSCEITSVEYDSRKIQPGSLFVAIIGFTSDGHSFIRQAVESGASAVLADSRREGFPAEELKETCGSSCTLVEVCDTRRFLALASAAFASHPEREITISGITGTKGKTTSTFMLHAMLEKAGMGAGLIGTVQNVIAGKVIHAEHTTPEAKEIYGMLSDLRDAGIGNLVMEVSSQGLKLDRVYGIRYKCACFTNLYEDHITPNEHPDMEDYMRCKLKIFDNCEYGIINTDCEDGRRAEEYARPKCKVITYGLGAGADVRAADLTKKRIGHVTGTEFTLTSPFYNGKVFTALPGEFNVYNALCAISCAGVLGVDFEYVKQALEEISVPGRVQPVANNLGITVLVDYAHNAAALESVIHTLRDYTTGRIITVFGCGGNRAKTRRFEMGEVSGNLSDYTVITSDNPRKEEPEAIIADIVTGISKTSGKYEIVIDRAEAIRKAIDMAQSGDTVLIAGKGHEDYQIFADQTIHFDDYEQAQIALEKAEAKRT